TIASDRYQAIIQREAKRFSTAVEEKGCDFHLIFAHGEIDRRAIGIMSAHERGVFRQKPLHGCEVSRDAGAEKLPDIRARAGGPQEWFILRERLGRDHALNLVGDTGL